MDEKLIKDEEVLKVISKVMKISKKKLPKI